MRSGERIARTLQVDGSEDRIVLFFWAHEEEPRVNNVARVSPTREVVWRAELPSGAAPDCFVKLWSERGHIKVQTYQQQQFELRPSTGELVTEPL